MNWGANIFSNMGDLGCDNDRNFKVAFELTRAFWVLGRYIMEAFGNYIQNCCQGHQLSICSPIVYMGTTLLVSLH